MLNANSARKAARAANDDFIELKERVGAAVTRACEAGRFEARIALVHSDSTDVIKEMTDHLESLGYRTEIMMLKDDQLVDCDSVSGGQDNKRILIVRFNAEDEKPEDDDECPEPNDQQPT